MIEKDRTIHGRRVALLIVSAEICPSTAQEAALIRPPLNSVLESLMVRPGNQPLYTVQGFEGEYRKRLTFLLEMLEILSAPHAALFAVVWPRERISSLPCDHRQNNVSFYDYHIHNCYKHV